MRQTVEEGAGGRARVLVVNARTFAHGGEVRISLKRLTDLEVEWQAPRSVTVTLGPEQEHRLVVPVNLGSGTHGFEASALLRNRVASIAALEAAQVQVAID